jgi:hypothetical protein
MRATTLVILLCMSSAVVSAQTTEDCHQIQGAVDLLACYNRTALPPHTLRKPKPLKASTAHKPAVSEAPIAVDKQAESTPTDQKTEYVDVLGAENSKLNAKMKTICRGC